MIFCLHFSESVSICVCVCVRACYVSMLPVILQTRNERHKNILSIFGRPFQYWPQQNYKVSNQLCFLFLFFLFHVCFTLACNIHIHNNKTNPKSKLTKRHTHTHTNTLQNSNQKRPTKLKKKTNTLTNLWTKPETQINQNENKSKFNGILLHQIYVINEKQSNNITKKTIPLTVFKISLYILYFCWIQLCNQLYNIDVVVVAVSCLFLFNSICIPNILHIYIPYITFE